MQLQFTVENLEYLLFIVTRVSAFVFTAPFFTFGQVPRRVKAGFVFLFSLLLYFSIPATPFRYRGIMDFAMILSSEVFAGALLGYFTNIVMSILNFAGRLIDMEIGFAMVTMFDPVFKVQSSVSGNLYSYFIILILLIGNFQHFFFKAFAEAFIAVPIGSVNLGVASVYVIVVFLRDYFIIAMRLMLPIYATMLLVNTVLGVMAKVAPQMNMFVVGIQLKLLAGLFILLLMMAMLPGVAEILIGEMTKIFKMAVEVMKSP